MRGPGARGQTGPRQPIRKATVIRLHSYLKPYRLRLLFVLSCVIIIIPMSSKPNHLPALFSREGKTWAK